MTEVIGVRFKNGEKTYFFDPGDFKIKEGTDVIVETSRGIEYGTCCEGNRMVEDSQVVQPLRPVIRIATEKDHKTMLENREKEKKAFDVCSEKILKHGLDMKLVEVEYNFEGSKIIFFFTSDGRVDFRELVKDLASVFRTRIELRQIGVRDEAKLLGGLGICGRPFCCSTFLNEFQPVSIKMAKTQNLSLNPAKISGSCGRLMCCLKYEQDAYEDAVKRMPKVDSVIQTEDGEGKVAGVNLLREQVKVSFEDRPELHTYVQCGESCKSGCEGCVWKKLEKNKDKEAAGIFDNSLLASLVYESKPISLQGSAAAEKHAEEEQKPKGKRSSRRRRRGGGKSPEKKAVEVKQPEKQNTEKRAPAKKPADKKKPQEKKKPAEKTGGAENKGYTIEKKADKKNRNYRKRKPNKPKEQ